MDHGIRGRKFNRRSSHRTAMLMNLVKSLIRHEHIKTTLPKAKDLRPLVEKIITIAKRGDLAARRQIISFMRGNTPEVQKLFGSVAEKCRNRKGGYTRIIKAGYRLGDSAPVAIIELVDRESATPEPKQKLQREKKAEEKRPKVEKAKIVS